jgi:hypothetical protein
VAALGTEIERQIPVRVEARMAWEGKGWIVDVVTQPWAQAIEEELKGGDGSSSEVRGGYAGVSVDVEKQGTDSKGKSRTRKKSQATRGEGEQEVEAALAHCTAAAGGGTVAAVEQSRGAEGAQGRR